MAKHRVTRRMMLAVSFAVTVAGVALPRAAIAEILRRRLPWAPRVADRTDAVDMRPGYLFFTPVEAAFVEAAASQLIPDDATGPGAVEASVPRFIDRQLAGPYGAGDHFYLRPPFAQGAPTQGWQMGAPADVYRAAIAEVNRWTVDTYGNPFAELDGARQETALKALEKGDAELRGTVDGKAFFALLLQNTIEGYFADPIYGGNRDMAAWQMIGFPGARYDYREFVARHNQPYPLPPVGLMGRRDWKAG